MKTFSTAIIITLLSVQLNFSQTVSKEKGLNSLTESSIQAQLEFLASDWMEGRETGTRGNLMAADYIASMFKVYGLLPAGNTQMEELTMRDYINGRQAKEFKTFFQNFPLVEYEPGEKQEFSLYIDNDQKEKLSFTLNTDYKIYPSGNGIELNAPVVFVGYGLKDDEKNYNDFSGTDVRGKFILRLAGYPGQNDTLSEGYKKFKSERSWQLRRNKNKAAKDLGAAGIIEIVSSDDIVDWATNEPFRVNLPYYEGDKELSRNKAWMQFPGDTLNMEPPTINISLRAANEIVKGSGISFSQFEVKAGTEFKSSSKLIKGKTVNLISTVKSRLIKTRNVLGIIKGESSDEIIVVGAHYDHVGTRQGYIWNGADDNASGTVGVLSIARAFMESGVKPKKTIVFAAWTGEEKGLFGSKYFVNNFKVPVKNLLLNLNYDMISRNDPDDSAGVKCSMSYTKAYPALKDITEHNNEEYKLGLKIEFKASEKPSGGSDHAPFAEKNVPVMYFMAGFHEDYHQPGDTVDKVDIHKMTNIIKLGFLNLWDIVNGDQNYFSTVTN